MIRVLCTGPPIEFLIFETPRVMGYAVVRNYDGHFSEKSLNSGFLKCLFLSSLFVPMNPKRF